MAIFDTWLLLLERQANDVQSAKLDLEDSKRADWRVLQAELRLDSVYSAYIRLLADAPPAVILAHLLSPECST